MRKGALLLVLLSVLIALGLLLSSVPPFSSWRPEADPSRALSVKLDALIGQTGLDPLDPVHPLVSYRVRRVLRPSVMQPQSGQAGAEIELRYADGSSRVYTIPVYQLDTARGGWAYTGLDRLFAPHQALSYLPAAGPAAPIRLGAPLRLPLHPDAHRLGAGDLLGWHTSTSRPGEEVRWAPNGQGFLLRTYAPGAPYAANPLWLVSLDGSPPRQVADKVETYIWSEDGRHIVFLRLIRASHPGLRYEVVALDISASVERKLGETDTPNIAVVAGDVLFLDETTLWRAPLDGRPPMPLGKLPDSASVYPAARAFAVAPDGERVAYRCGNDLCLADVTGANPIRVALGFASQPTVTPLPPGAPPGPAPTAPPMPDPEQLPPRLAALHLAWGQDGERLAVVMETYAPSSRPMPELWLLDRSGVAQRRGSVGPNGGSRDPQWTPDGRFVVLNTFPEDGRRIVAVEVATGQVVDLSQPRWDTFASLAPDGKSLLLWNGRGGFWTALLELGAGGA